MKNTSHYGTIIPDLKIDGQPAPYPVVNERGIRAAAGIMLAMGFATFWFISVTGDYRALYIVVTLFWIDFFLKSVFSPSWSIFGNIGELIVKKQKPEYVGAIQKRFAWSLGLIMASAMMITAVFMGIRGWLPFSICFACLTLMWLESAFGICVGCKMYNGLINKGFIQQPEHKPACPGGACSIKR